MKNMDDLFNKAENLYLKTELPNMPDYDRINRVLVENLADDLILRP
jgi:hypothetical protein